VSPPGQIGELIASTSDVVIHPSVLPPGQIVDDIDA
jgi:hypothetical protein